MTERRRTVSILAPAFNEENNLERAVREAVEAASGFEDFEILVVDDGSTDRTGEIADRLAREIPQVVAIHHPVNMGMGAAYQTALDHARMDFITWTGGDGELPLESLRAILAAVGSADLVVPYHGTPWARTWLRRVLTWVYTTQLNLLFGWRLRYYSGPTVYPTALARTLPRASPGFSFATERLVNALARGCSYVEVPLCHQEREHGQSKRVNLHNLVNGQWTILRLWWTVRVRPSRAAPRVARDEPGRLAGSVE